VYVDDAIYASAKPRGIAQRAVHVEHWLWPVLDMLLATTGSGAEQQATVDVAQQLLS
jgi:hypothetical protein